MGSESVKTATAGVDWQHPAAAHLIVKDHEQALVVAAPGTERRKKIAIVGFASSSKDLAPFHDPAWEIWGLNQLYRHIPRADRWFEIHSYYNAPGTVVEGTDYDGWLATCPIPIYMTEHLPSAPTSVKYPLARMASRFLPYFTSTIAYMLALAIDELQQLAEAEFRDAFLVGDPLGRVPDDVMATRKALFSHYLIAIFGVDLIVGTEYDYQKACVERLLGIADGLGLTVAIPKESALCKASHLYGYQPEPDYGPLNMSVLAARKQLLTEQRNKLRDQLYAVDGALQESEYLNGYLDLCMKGAYRPGAR